MSGFELEMYLRFTHKYKINDIITVPAVVCQNKFKTSLNTVIGYYDEINLKIDYIGNYGFTGRIISNLEDKYIGTEISVRYAKLKI